METKLRPRVICVDDEPHIASGLALHLRRRYDVEIAGSGQAGLDLLARKPEAAVVLSDMRMPGMNGAEFLSKAAIEYPNTTRLLLTGYAEVDAAIRAINEGQVFRFLVKPCPPPELLRTFEDAVEHYRLRRTEQVLLEQTLHGSVKMLFEVLAVTNPAAFGRAARIKQHVSRLADKLGEKQRWQVEVAAMLSQLGTITLPNETNEKLYYGTALTTAEQQMVERAPDVTEQLLAHIPRLEPVREILAARAKPYRSDGRADLSDADRLVRRGAQLLKVAVEYDAMEAQGLGEQRALDTLRGRADEFDPDVLAALFELGGGDWAGEAIREVSLAALKPGMVFAADVKLTTGPLFVARGYEITESFLERLRNFRAGSVSEPVKVLVRSA